MKKQLLQGALKEQIQELTTFFSKKLLKFIVE